MAFGSNRSSRLKIAFCALGFSLLLLFVIPFLKGYAQFTGLDHNRTNGLDQYWPAVYLVSIAFVISMLTVILTHLLKIEGEGQATFKVLGIEAPIELRGASLVLVLLGLAVGVATYYWDITGLAELDDRISELQNEQERNAALLEEKEVQIGALSAQKELLLAVLAGERNQDGIQVLSLSVACGATPAEQYSAWELYQPDSDVAWNTYETPDKPLMVGHQPRTYRMTTRGREMIRLAVEFTEEGVVRVDLDGNTRLSDFCSWISEAPSSGFGTENAEHVELPVSVETSNDLEELGDIDQSAKRDG